MQLSSYAIFYKLNYDELFFFFFCLTCHFYDYHVKMRCLLFISKNVRYVMTMKEEMKFYYLTITFFFYPYMCILYLNTIYVLLIWIYRRLTITTQERLDEMTRVSSTLNKVLGSNLACIGHAAALKFLERICCSFGSHNACGISLRGCARRYPVYTKNNNRLCWRTYWTCKVVFFS